MTPRLMLSMLFVAAVTAPAAAQPAQSPVRDQSVGAGAQWALPHPGGGATPGLQLTWRRWISPRFGIGTDLRWWGRSSTTEITSRGQIRQDGVVIPAMQGRDDQRISSSGFGAGIFAKGSIGRLSLIGGAGPGFFVDRGTHERRRDGLHDGGRETIRSLGVHYGVNIRIRPGVSAAEANAGLQPILKQFAAQSPGRYPDDFRVNLRSIIEMYARPMGPRLFLLLGAVTSLLLVGCANVSILLLVRGAHRQQELAVRGALGAGRARLVRQLLTEAMVIAVTGAALGVLIAWKGLALIVAWVPTNSFAAESVIEMNLPVLLFSTALACVTALLFGVWPALQLSRPDLGRVAQVSSRRVIGNAQVRRLHRVMVAAQVALTLLMLTAAGAAGKGFLRLANADLGYDPQNTMSLPIPVHDGTYQTWKERSEYFERLRAAVAALPQVVSAGISTNATPPSSGGDTTIEILGISALEKPVARSNFVSAEYFPILHIPLTQGRLWNQPEIARGAPLAVINQAMARQYWPKGDAIGRQFRFVNMKDEPPYSPASAGAGGWIEVVGVVADARNDGLRNPTKPAFYVPYSLKLRMFTQILVRTKVAPLSILRDVRAELVRVDREQQVMRVRDLQGWITDLPEYAQQRLVARLFGIFSILALALSAVGLYSVVSYGVAARTNEFGIRMALGARARDVVRMVLSGTSWNVGLGLLAGVLMCVIFDNLASRWVTESSRDPMILGGVTALLVAVAVMACLAPARRAASIDPMEAVRHE